ncbi:nickel-type superoxide dismutase maturation protease [bacterium]|jgi:nickel-type superoxide dismutase maturation protease|nr:nickel-type superoxide dismutase maturation protease [bacterium]
MDETRGNRLNRLAPVFLSATAAGLAAATVGVFERRFSRYLVTGASMEPALHDGDWLIVDLKAYTKRLPEPGHVVVARDPREPTREIIKRVERIEPFTGLTWLAGDNQHESTDSRHFGPVTREHLIGQVRWRYWHAR